MLGDGDVVVALLKDEAVSGKGKHAICGEHVKEGGIELGEDGGKGIIVCAGSDADDCERKVGRADEGERKMGLGRGVCGEAEMEMAGLESILGHKAGWGECVSRRRPGNGREDLHRSSLFSGRSPRRMVSKLRMSAA
jgi:hypothetical protein